MFQNTCSHHIFKDLVDSLGLAIRLRVMGRTVDQVSPEGRVQLLPKVSDNYEPQSEIIIFGTPCKHNTQAM
jgi:hypothetical protein